MSHVAPSNATQKVMAQFKTKYGDTFYGYVEALDGNIPSFAKLQQYAGTFSLFTFDDHHPVYHQDV